MLLPLDSLLTLFKNKYGKVFLESYKEIILEIVEKIVIEIGTNSIFPFMRSNLSKLLWSLEIVEKIVIEIGTNNIFHSWEVIFLDYFAA